MIRFLLYVNEWDVKGLIYSSSKHHWEGDAEHPEKKWHNTVWIEEQIDKYAEVYPNLKKHDPGYPSPDYLKSQVFVGNIAIEGDMLEETPGCYVLLGAGPGAMVHNPHYDFNDQILTVGARYWAALAEHELSV